MIIHVEHFDISKSKTARDFQPPENGENKNKLMITIIAGMGDKGIE